MIRRQNPSKPHWSKSKGSKGNGKGNRNKNQKNPKKGKNPKTAKVASNEVRSAMMASQPSSAQQEFNDWSDNDHSFQIALDQYHPLCGTRHNFH